MPQLAELIRKKHPGSYDDMDDETLEKSVLEKYPEYADLTLPTEEIESDEPAITLDKVKKAYNNPEVQRFLYGATNADVGLPQDAPPIKGPGFIEIPGVNRGAKWIADKIDNPQGEGGYLKGFAAGAIEGIGNIFASGVDPRTVTPGRLPFPKMKAPNVSVTDLGPTPQKLLTAGKTYVSPKGKAYQGELPIRKSTEIPYKSKESFNLSGDDTPRATETFDKYLQKKQTSDTIVNNTVVSETPYGGSTKENLPIRQNPITAKFRGWQETGFDDMPDFALYDIQGGSSHKSTVDADHLRKLGIDIPETPTNPRLQRMTDSMVEGGIKYPEEELNALDRFQNTEQNNILANAETPVTSLGTIPGRSKTLAERLTGIKEDVGGINWGPEAPLETPPIKNPAANLSVRDLMNPESMSTMDAMYNENNSIFKGMQEKGMFSDRNNAEIPDYVLPVEDVVPAVEKGKIGPHNDWSHDQLIDAVISGKKPSAILESIPDQQLGMVMEKVKAAGLHITENPLLPDELIISKDPSTGQQLIESFNSGDSTRTGKLLGYSEEDIAAFEQNKNKKFIDLEQTENMSIAEAEEFDKNLNKSFYPKDDIKFLHGGIGGIPSPKTGKKVPTTPTEQSVNNLLDAINKNKGNRSAQEAINKKERARRFADFASVKSEGMKGAKASLGKLKGEFEKVEASTLQLSEKDSDNLFTAIKKANITPAEKATGYTALFKILNGGNVPARSELKILDEIFGAGFSDKIVEMHGGLGMVGFHIGKVANTMKSMTSSTDLSFSLRQGMGLIHKKEFREAFIEMFKYIGKPEYYKAAMESIEHDPEYILGRKANLFISKPGQLFNAEEAFLNSYVPNLPVVRDVVGTSERAYTGMANLLRFKVFKSLLKSARLAGHEAFTVVEHTDELGNTKHLIEPTKLTEDLAKVINNGTGRGSLGTFEKIAPELNWAIWSPKLIASRLTVLNPKYYKDLEPFARKEAIKSLLAIAATWTTISTLGVILGNKSLGNPLSGPLDWFGWNKSKRPAQILSSDFGKIRGSGDKVLDPAGGFQQPIVAASRFISGRSDAGPQNRAVTAGRFAKNKLSPIASLAWEIASAQTWSGKSQPGNLKTLTLPGYGGFTDEYGNEKYLNREIALKFVPLFIQDMQQLMQDDPSFAEFVGFSGPAVFGAGSQNYPERVPGGLRSGFRRMTP